MSCHSVEKCYKLNGYPLAISFIARTRTLLLLLVAPSRACSVDDHDEESFETMALTKGQYNQLLALLHSKDTSSAMATMSVTQPSPSSQHVTNSKVSGLSILDND
ncbi:hypothetical protein F0562_021683 [Nyssa sinensis]|uniref:Uncharacterized protein n=1 Tax=Nyssa sinensis TaxID=561372 RepID=A0A5J5BQV2_9ASTE|nr:hypothetical protein F0562_021683 [Nyssa sinensis]